MENSCCEAGLAWAMQEEGKANGYLGAIFLRGPGALGESD